MNAKTDIKRRRFLQKLAWTAGASSLWATQSKLQLMGSALAAASNYAALKDYRTLVCVFLNGGCDTFNLIVPYTAALHQDYLNVRQGLAIPASQLLRANGTEYAFSPNARELQTLFHEGRLGVVPNVGALVRPLNVTTYYASRANPGVVPGNLFSHSDQTTYWQTARPTQVTGAPPGWAGLAADLLISANSSASLPCSLSLAGSNAWQTGAQTQPLVTPAGISAPSINAFDGSPAPLWEAGRSAAWQSILRLSRANLLEAKSTRYLRDAQSRSELLRAGLDLAPDIATPFNNKNPLAQQLLTAARLISVRQALGMKRQIIFASLGGFDTHATQGTLHPALVQQLSEALMSFYRATEELGVANSVLTFTASDFGRTLTTNGDGTDHAWATDALVMGGDVRGGLIHGEPINFTDTPATHGSGAKLYGPMDTGGGRFIPKYSVDQYGATLARWMGLTESDILTVFPSLKNFSNRNLGFV